MVFSSISFLYYFLPIMMLVYIVMPKQYRNLALFMGSLFFYFLGEPKYCMLLLFSTGIDYFHGRVIESNRGTNKAKLALISSVVINLMLLGFFKYSDFIIEFINLLTGSDFKALHLPLPIGISFFTFQTMSYTIDVYRGEAKAQKSIIDLGTYVVMFPQLIAGPIVRYKSISEEINHRHTTWTLVSDGVKRFMIGLSKKILLANTLGELVASVNTANQPSILHLWLGAIAFSLQIYFDFSGYSDMAIGLGKFFGFHFPENFNYPYISSSISEFWRRWHISLGQWFKDYVYIPLGGNKGTQINWIRNIAIVWLLTGLWHGAGWNFVLWGGFLGGFIILEKVCLEKILHRLPKTITHIYVIMLIIISFVLFSHNNIGEAWRYLLGMFGIGNILNTTVIATYDLNKYWVLILVSIVGATPIPKLFYEQMNKYEPLKTVTYVATPIVLGILLIVCTGYLVDSSFNPFLYFRF